LADPAPPVAAGLAPARPASSKRLLALVIVAVVLVAGLGAAVVLILSTPTAPPGLDRVEVSASRSRVDQRDEFAITARAIDAAGVDQAAIATLVWSAVPAGRLGTTGSGAQIAAVALQAGTVTITARATLRGVEKAGNATVTIDPIAFEVTPSDASPLTGNPIDLDVRVVRVDATTATAYAGTVTFASDDPLASLPADGTFAPSDGGTRTFSGIVLRTAGMRTVTVSDTVAAVQRGVTIEARRPIGGPAASFNATRDLMQVDVDAGATADPDNDIASYAWAWGDTTSSGPSAVPTASHTYATPGRYLVVLTVTDSQANEDLASRWVSVGTSTVDYDYYDFFNVPFADHWDLRSGNYWELPINAECFNATAVAQGVCKPTNANVSDVTTYPYAFWYSPPTYPTLIPSIWAPYRMDVTGVDVPGYTLEWPVFVPVLNETEGPGALLEFEWYFQYLNQSRGIEVGTECGTRFGFGNEGYVIESRIEFRMDLQESRRTFGVLGSNGAEAQAWWAANADPICGNDGPAELAYEDWFLDMGGRDITVGRYDIANGYEWYYEPFSTNINATVDPATGETTLSIVHLAWGTEVLLARMFYWGNASYADHYLDSRQAAGWWGMENAWFEDFHFAGSLGATNFDFALRTVMQYTMQQVCDPGPNGQYDRVDDVPVWIWGASLDDYENDFFPQHQLSEIDRYPSATYVHCVAGADDSLYGTPRGFDYTPVAWNLKVGETWRFRFPTENVTFYDPNNTPEGAIPTDGGYAVIDAALALESITPASFGTTLGTWDAATGTWSVYGPANTGAPSGHAGPDETPGTADDAYALEWSPLIRFTPGGAGSTGAPARVGTFAAIGTSPVTTASTPSAALQAALIGWTAALLLLLPACRARRAGRADL